MRSKVLFSFTILALFYSIGHSQQLDPDGTRFYWMEDWSTGDTYLEKFVESEWDKWVHSAARMDAYVFRRNSIPGLMSARSSNNAKWQGFKKKVSNSVWIAAMNTGLPNKSWEYADRQTWINRFSGDLGIIRAAKDAGFSEIVLFMQSVLSKGQQPTFDPSVVNESQPNGGADLEQRVQDCLEYANYIEANRVQGIEVSYALICAFPTKNNFGDRSIYRDAYRNLIQTFRDANIPFKGFSFDIKTASIKNNVSQLTNECKFIQELEDEFGGDKIRKGWYTWSTPKLTVEQKEIDIAGAMEAIKGHVDGNYVEDIWIAGNGESGFYPDYINGPPTTRQERFNQIFCILEDIEDNPTAFGDPILGPTNSVETPPSGITNFEVEINTVSKLTLTWNNALREDTYKIKRFDNGIKTDTLNIGSTLKDITTFVDTTIEPGKTYIYFVSAENEYGRTFSEEVEVTISTTPPAQATEVTQANTGDCYENAINWTDNSDNENNYIILRRENGVTGESVIATLDADNTSYVDTDIIVGKIYSYNVAASNHIDTIFSEWVEANSVSCTSTPTEPNSLVATPNECGLTNFTWHDAATNETGFEFQVKPLGKNWVSYALPKDAQNFSIQLDFDTDFAARIRAFNTLDSSAWSKETQFSTTLCNCDRSTFGNEGKPWSIGQYVEAENFDYCTNDRIGQYITYNEINLDSHATVSGFRENELVDLFNTTTDSEGDKIVRTGSIEKGEYLEYTFNVENAGSYEMQFRLGSKNTSIERSFNIYSNDQLLTNFSYYGTSDANWKYYIVFTSSSIELAAGEQIIRIESISGGTDMDWFRIVSEGSLSLGGVNANKINIHPNPAHDFLYIQLGNEQEAQIQVYSLNGSQIETVNSKSNFTTLDTSRYKNGLYLLKITTPRGISYHKVVVK